MTSGCIYTIDEDVDPIFENERETLVIKCEKCPIASKYRKSDLSNGSCLANIIKIVSQNQTLTNISIETMDGLLRLKTLQVELLTDYSHKIMQISTLKTPNIQRDLGCARENDCRNELQILLEHMLGNKFHTGLFFSNPIMAFDEIYRKIGTYEKISVKKKHCNKCYTPLVRYLSAIRSTLDKTRIIQGYLALDRKNRTSSEIYNLIFGDYSSDMTQFNAKSVSIDSEGELSATYKKGPYEIKIVKNSKNGKYFYRLSTIAENPELNQIFNDVIQKVDSKPKEYFDFNKPLKLNFLLQYEKKRIFHLIRRDYKNLSTETATDLAELVVYELTNLNPLMAFLIDDEIEEVFLDSPNAFMYLDHRQFGRCWTNITLTPMKIESLKTRVRLEAEQRLDENQPFLKTEIITDDFHIRATIQIYPQAVKGFSLNIRKLHKKVITLVDLIKNTTISIEAASYLLFCYIHGRCILVIGEPYAGKTTLINSLDLIGKEDWRKICFEDTIESIDQTPYGIHQIQVQVDTNTGNYETKSFQVKESLHRTPDAIFIGELIHTETVQSFFFLLKVGLRRCLATAHGESPELMVEKFIHVDQIHPTLIGNLDVIVQMRRFEVEGHEQNVRRVTRITEIQKGTDYTLTGIVDPLKDPQNISFNDLFMRNPETDILEKSYESLNALYKKSSTIKNIKLLRGELVSNSSFQKEMGSNIETFEDLLKNEVNGIADIINAFRESRRNMKIRNE